MSEKQASTAPASTTKKFGKGEREVPHHSQKAKKWYPAEDESKPRKVYCTLVVELMLRWLGLSMDSSWLAQLRESYKRRLGLARFITHYL
jgi:hypothetical protein